MMMSMNKIKNWWELLGVYRRQPSIRICLMLDRALVNHVFFQDMVRGFYADARRRHPRFPVMRRMTSGVAVCELPATFDDYFMLIEAAGRRNYKKALRLGYEFKRLDYNAHLPEITDILRSTDVRQGKMPEELLTDGAQPHRNPESLSRYHDYPYFGIFHEGTVVAFGSCLVAGELAMIERIYGHAAHQANGVVPMLLIGMTKAWLDEYPGVKYFAYGTYFGASESLRRFKRKFLFYPHRVKWIL